MKTAQNKETERILIAIAGAVIIHIVLFLIIEYTDIVRTEEPAEFVGPMLVEISQVTTIPESADEAEQEEPVEEEPFLEDQDAVPAQPEAAPEEAPEERTSPDTEAPTVEEEAAEEVPPADQSTTAEEAEESKTDYIVPTPPEEQDETPPNEFNGSDAGNEFSIKVGSVADKARAQIGPKFSDFLPDWVQDIDQRIEVKFSFIVGEGGRISNVRVEKKSGYNEIDQALIEALLQWEFSNPLFINRIVGEFTYVIKP